MCLPALLRSGCLALVLSGCAGYQLGPAGGLKAGAQSIQINPIANQTLEPRLSDAVNQALRTRLQQDGTFRLSTRGEGDIIVTGAILRFDRSEVSFQPNDVLTVRDYGLSITAHINARERTSGKVLLDRPVSGRATVRVGTDLPSAERQAVPLLAEDLARRVTSLLVDGNW